MDGNGREYQGKDRCNSLSPAGLIETATGRAYLRVVKGGVVEEENARVKGSTESPWKGVKRAARRGDISGARSLFIRRRGKLENGLRQQDKENRQLLDDRSVGADPEDGAGILKRKRRPTSSAVRDTSL